MKKLLIGVLAVAAGIYAEKKYNVSGRMAEQIKKYTSKDIFEEDMEIINEEEV